MYVCKHAKAALDSVLDISEAAKIKATKDAAAAEYMKKAEITCQSSAICKIVKCPVKERESCTVYQKELILKNAADTLEGLRA